MTTTKAEGGDSCERGMHGWREKAEVGGGLQAREKRAQTRAEEQRDESGG